MITHIRIQNLRSLVDTGFIEIKPLTILLGANSSGKSTFLRSFPLFTQSVSKSLREPISWFDDAYVDFGDFDTAKSKMSNEDDGIVVSYKIKSPFYLSPEYYFLGRRNPEYIITNPDLIIPGSEVSLSFVKDKHGTFINRVSIKNKNIAIDFKIKDREAIVEMYVNGESVMEDSKWKWHHGSKRSLIPEFESQRKTDEIYYRVETWIYDNAFAVLYKYCTKQLRKIERLWPIIRNWTEDKIAFLDTLQKVRIATLKNRAKTWTIESEEFKEVYNNLALFYAIRNLGVIDDEIKSMYTSCSYIAPVRAAANRYYRTQGLQVRDVDPYGKNLQEFISSLSGNREKSYRDFTKRVLGLQVMVQNKAGHQQIILKNEYRENNMTDVGFGYSQILPIITKLWYSRYRLLDDKNNFYYKKNYVSDIMLIEQPELHLHPAMQARIADIMMLVLNDIDINVNEQQEQDDLFLLRQKYSSSLIVETHSQAMINRIGKRIREKRFSADNVSILLFEKDQETGVTSIRPITYNENGQLTNWPYGFFEPTDDYDILFDRQSQNKGK